MIVSLSILEALTLERMCTYLLSVQTRIVGNHNQAASFIVYKQHSCHIVGIGQIGWSTFMPAIHRPSYRIGRWHDAADLISQVEEHTIIFVWRKFIVMPALVVGTYQIQVLEIDTSSPLSFFPIYITNIKQDLSLRDRYL